MYMLMSSPLYGSSRICAPSSSLATESRSKYCCIIVHGGRYLFDLSIFIIL